MNSQRLNICASMRIVTSSYGEYRDAVSHDLVRWIHALEHDVTLVPNVPSSAASYLRNSALLILTGGDTPVLSSASQASESPLAVRDRTEFALLERAIETGVPVLGICRGAQLINLYFGGSCRATPGHVKTEHAVNFVSQHFKDLFREREIVVNSFHSIRIDSLGRGLAIGAMADDISIEGFSHSKLQIVGLMWHPERTSSDSRFATAHRHLISQLVRKLCP